MSTNNRQLTLRWMNEVWNQRNDAAIEELLDPEVCGYFEGLGFVGKESFLAGRQKLLETFPDLHVEVEDTIAEGDHVVVRWRVDGTHLGSSPELPATGRKVQFRGMTWMAFQRGRIVQGWDAWNQGALIAELAQAYP